jgi:hypothetical protein
MLELKPTLNKKFILSRVSQEEIFEKFLGDSVIIGRKYLSPFRSDRHPTCSFRYNSSGVLRFRDWNGSFEGDCFNFVQNLPTYAGLGFQQVIEVIAKEFGLINKAIIRQPRLVEWKEHARADIKVQYRDWREFDLSFWERGLIQRPLLDYFKVAPVKYVWVNGVIRYSDTLLDPGYAYWFGPDDIKIYFPYRKEYRFLGNSSLLQGYEQLPKTAKTLIITKSLKDVMTLYNFGYPSIAPQTETCVLSQAEYDELSSRFESIYSMYDFDLTGIKGANKMKKKYGIKPTFLTDGRFGSYNYESKDPFDLVSKLKVDASQVFKKLWL